MNIDELEQLAFRIHASVNALGAIQCAIDNGPATGETWADGLWSVYRDLDDLSDKLQDLVEAADEPPTSPT
ncbi:MAG: hypothetical protein LUG65_03215 [Clostridiales bacterium]|nr:hypothetical protein [Clostridiales bacterium]